MEITQYQVPQPTWSNDAGYININDSSTYKAFISVLSPNCILGFYKYAVIHKQRHASEVATY